MGLTVTFLVCVTQILSSILSCITETQFLFLYLSDRGLRARFIVFPETQNLNKYSVEE